MKKLISALLILTMLVSMVCVSTSAAGVHIDMNFESMDVFTSQFIAGAFYTSDAGTLYGYAEAKALQSIYETDDDLGVFKNAAYTWLTYDATITLQCADDELSETGRYINLVYCNDNLKILGREEDRVMMAFMYDVEGRCFRFARGFNATEDEAQIMEPVAMEIDTDGEEFITLGMSVDKGRIRCFYNDKLIFDFVDSNEDYMIANEINSCFLFWQDGNFVNISNIKVADQGYLFPYPAADDGNSGNGSNTGDNGNGGNGGNTGDNGNIGNGNTDNGNSGNTGNTGNTGNSGNSGNTGNSGNNAGNAGNNGAEKPADTNQNKPAGGNSTATGDMAFVVVAVMVATLGCALIVRKASVR